MGAKTVATMSMRVCLLVAAVAMANGLSQKYETREWIEPAAVVAPSVADSPDAKGCSIGGCGDFTLTVNKIRRGGTGQVQIKVSPQDSVQAVIDRLETRHHAQLRHHKEFDNQPTDLSLLDVGMSQSMQVDLMIADTMKGPPPSHKMKIPVKKKIAY